ncbi:hypothetical protein V6N13_095167 [Hibiscus sabdariffa]|uniref:F-box associated beta-propeller type 1 domain-containing protein n=1 Tax=Hibiscus sabdariffa TaxID=183260 RepID=A0ABR2PSK2_9ROSI
MASSDVLFEILSRADLETMSKCRLVSRECNALTYTPSFMRSHCERTNTLCGQILYVSSPSGAFWRFKSIDNPGSGVRSRSIDFNFLCASSVRILAVVHIGMFCCQVRPPSGGIRYLVCKPTTCQWRIIPAPRSLDSSPLSLYFMTVLKSKPLKFKILRLQPRSFCNFNCEIFDSDVWSWKQLDDLNLPDSQSLQDYRHAKIVCGRLYWITLIQDEYGILIFDQDKENWEMNQVPDPCKNRLLYEVKLSVYGGKLAIMGKRRDIETMEVWVMRYNHGVKCWNKLQTIFNPENLMQPDFSNAADTFLTWECCIYDRQKFCNFHYRNVSGSKFLYDRSVYFLQTDYEPIPGIRWAIQNQRFLNK